MSFCNVICHLVLFPLKAQMSIDDIHLKKKPEVPTFIEVHVACAAEGGAGDDLIARAHWRGRLAGGRRGRGGEGGSCPGKRALGSTGEGVHVNAPTCACAQIRTRQCF